MKNLSPPSPHFNDEKKSAFWFARELIIDMGGGGFVSHFILSKIVNVIFFSVTFSPGENETRDKFTSVVLR